MSVYFGEIRYGTILGLAAVWQGAGAAIDTREIFRAGRESRREIVARGVRRGYTRSWRRKSTGPIGRDGSMRQTDSGFREGQAWGAARRDEAYLSVSSTHHIVHFSSARLVRIKARLDLFLLP